MSVCKKEPLSIPYTMWKKKTQNGLDLNVKPKTINILFFKILLYFTLQYCIGFAIHQHAS